MVTKPPEAIRQYEQEAGRERLKVFALTADIADGNRERCLKSGMDDFLSKPMGKDLLSNVLTKWFE